FMMIRAWAHPEVGNAIPRHSKLVAAHAGPPCDGGMHDGRAGEGDEIRGRVTLLAGDIPGWNVRRRPRRGFLQSRWCNVRERQPGAMALRAVVADTAVIHRVDAEIVGVGMTKRTIAAVRGRQGNVIWG